MTEDDPVDPGFLPAMLLIEFLFVLSVAGIVHSLIATVGGESPREKRKEQDGRRRRSGLASARFPAWGTPVLPAIKTERYEITGPVRLMLSKSCEYGLRATYYLSSLDRDGYVSIGTISEDLGISFPFLTKIFQQLNDAGLLSSRRGPKGGVSLTKSPDEITLYDIVVSIDGDDLFEECVLGLPGCGEAEPCPLHEEWSEERTRVKQMFQNNTLAELPNVRLAARE